MLFVDFSSAFNTVIPDKLALKLRAVGLPVPLDQRLSYQQAPGGENRERNIIPSGPQHGHATGLCAQPSPLHPIHT